MIAYTVGLFNLKPVRFAGDLFPVITSEQVTIMLKHGLDRPIAQKQFEGYSPVRHSKNACDGMCGHIDPSVTE